MKSLRLLLGVAVLAMPLMASAARADNVTASQLSAAGHGRQPMMSNRPSREVYHRHMRRHAPRRHHRGAY
ncbi:hypothetical protein P7D22_17360 [Lichenihabitans sp. Uapishka_5]|uniref:hypothetical protein n=1 Tax=Lichenihabitans sp. Uapishka_5 TaxID=3037302 RepID=UPI0029E822BD|nr:hypothetical protein [Lichenihabitans sp. Uapishka_5]MDX7952935.1 hypothetical protein [Lichenihabitans sp. Uapishka_5]